MDQSDHSFFKNQPITVLSRNLVTSPQAAHPKDLFGQAQSPFWIFAVQEQATLARIETYSRDSVKIIISR